jgi:tRNA dimethylallyltransferase
MLQRESSMSGRKETQRGRAVLIAGPTASGKSALALALAECTDGVVINADSMQVYRDLRVITARPTEPEEARAPHRLYGHVDAADSYSAGRWLADVQAALKEAHATDRLPIVVGGTGLYFKLLTEGLAEMPTVSPDIRAALRTRLASHGSATLHAELQQRDPLSAERIRPGDGSRVLRALEVIEATGRSLTEWQQGNMPPVLDRAQAVTLFLNPERDELRRRIDARFDAMLDAGAVEEACALANRRLDPLLPSMKAHGVPWLIRHLRGEIGLDEAAAQAKADTKRYTKRQFTWFRNQLPDWPWLAPANALDHLRAALAPGVRG